MHYLNFPLKCWWPSVLFNDRKEIFIHKIKWNVHLSQYYKHGMWVPQFFIPSIYASSKHINLQYHYQPTATANHTWKQCSCKFHKSLSKYSHVFVHTASQVPLITQRGQLNKERLSRGMSSSAWDCQITR